MTTVKVRLNDIEYSDKLSLNSIFTPLNSNIRSLYYIEFSDNLAKFDIHFLKFEYTGVLLLTIYSKLGVQISNKAIKLLNSIFTSLKSNIHGMSDIEFGLIWLYSILGVFLFPPYIRN